MSAYRQFNFDDPEDSYWNDEKSDTKRSTFGRQASEASSSFFDGAELGTTVTEAANIFGGLSFTQNHCDLADFSNNSVVADSTKWIDIQFNDVQSLSDKSSVMDGQKRYEVPISYNIGRDSRAAGTSIISDCGLGSRASELTIHVDYARLKAEHRKLKKHFETIRNERFNALPIIEAVRRLAKCEPVALDLYRTRQEKAVLIDTALDTLEHDVIVEFANYYDDKDPKTLTGVLVILHLKQTLCNALFREILILNFEAAEYYIKHLREYNDTSELIDTLFALGRSEEAAMVEFVKACRQRHPTSRLNALRKCLISGFSVPALESESRFVHEYVAELERSEL